MGTKKKHDTTIAVQHRRVTQFSVEGREQGMGCTRKRGLSDSRPTYDALSASKLTLLICRPVFSLPVSASSVFYYAVYMLFNGFVNYTPHGFFGVLFFRI